MLYSSLGVKWAGYPLLVDVVIASFSSGGHSIIPHFIYWWPFNILFANNSCVLTDI